MEGINAGFVCWAGGQWREDAPHLSVSDVSAESGRSGGILAVLVELAGDAQGRAAMAARMISAMQDAYVDTPGTATLALRRAVEAASAFLYEANTRVQRDARRYAGVSCVLVSRGDVYIAQAGPAVAYVTQAGALQRFPADSPWLSADPGLPIGTAWTPLGVRPSAPINMFHCQVGVEDSVALATSNLPRLVNPDDLEAALDQDPEIIMREMAGLSSAGQDFTVLVLQMPSAEIPSAPPRLARAPGRAEVGSAPGTPGLAPQPASAHPPEAPGGTADAQAMPAWLKLPERAALAAFGANALSVLRRLSAGLAAGTRTLLWRLLPERSGSGQVTYEESLAGRRLLMGLSLGFPVAIVVFTLVFYVQQQGHYARLLDRVRERQQAAQAHPGDRQAAAAALREALQAADEAASARPDDPAAAQLRQSVAAQLDQVRGVTRLTGFVTLAELPAAVQVRRVWVAGDAVYVLDTGNQQVLRYSLASAGGDPVRVLAKGETQAGRTVARLIDLAGEMLPAAGRPVRASTGRLFVLADDQVVWVAGADAGLRPLPAAGLPAPGSIRAISFLDSALYILDAGRGQVMRAQMAASGPGRPEDWLPKALALTSAIDMAVDKRAGDGEPYAWILQGDGSLDRLVGGKQEKVAVSGLDEPLGKPVGLFTAAGSSALYVSDAGRARVVQMTKEGQFVRQFRSPAAASAGLQPAANFDDAGPLFVDETAGRLVVAAGRRLVMATFIP